MAKHKRKNASALEPSPPTAGASERTSTISAGVSIPNILIVEDDTAIRNLLTRLYTETNYTVVGVGSVEEALEQLSSGKIDFVITDVKLPGLSGIDLIGHIQENCPDVPVIAMTGFSDIKTAVKALKKGAVDYIVKPFDLAAVQESTLAALEKSRVYMEIRQLRRGFKNRSEFGGMLSKTPEMHRLFELIRMVAPTEMTVSVEGETGTGKELVASAIHFHSDRRKGPFVTINCAGFPETLLESELFGYERGAFTGAVQSKPGKIELAHGGTLFLDEIESMSVVMQGKMLRVLEDQKVERLGGNTSVHVDMRIVTATNVPLKDLVSQGQMRSDFYYRINVVPLHLIPLRERKIDIPLLVQDFLHHHPLAIRKGISTTSKEALRQLLDYSWPGNIRELQNVLERAIVLNTGRSIERLDMADVSNDIRSTDQEDFSVPLEQWLKENEKMYLTQKLAAFGGNVGLTAKSCGIGTRTLSRKMHDYGLSKEAFRENRSELEPQTKPPDHLSSTSESDETLQTPAANLQRRKNPRSAPRL